MPNERILIVEDDPKLARLLQDELERTFDVRHAASGHEALFAASENDFDVVLLDLNLPDLDGLDVAKRLGDHADIIMLTARGDVRDRVDGLYAGASDYVTKPFSMDELLARIHVRLRERGRSHELRYGNLVLDERAALCTVAGTPLELSALERKLLGLFFANPGRVYSKSDLETRLYDGDGPASNTIEVFVSRLRAKLNAAGFDGQIQTIRGMGYVVRPEEPRETPHAPMPHPGA